MRAWTTAAKAVPICTLFSFHPMGIGHSDSIPLVAEPDPLENKDERGKITRNLFFFYHNIRTASHLQRDYSQLACRRPLFACPGNPRRPTYFWRLLLSTGTRNGSIMASLRSPRPQALSPAEVYLRNSAKSPQKSTRRNGRAALSPLSPAVDNSPRGRAVIHR